jgi:flagellar motility protein MotE (MotC chaperone)
MLKAGTIVFAVFCVAAVVSEVAGLGLLWYRGQLTKRTVREIEVILTGSDVFGLGEEAETQEQKHRSMDEIDKDRTLAIMELRNRNSLAETLMDEVLKIRDKLAEDQEILKKDRETFREEINRVNEKLNNESAELARGVLLASSPKEAVNRLLDLTVEDDVILLRQMPEESVAQILKAWKGTKEDERAKFIFEALNRGEPAKSVVDNQLGTPRQGEPTATAPAG